MPSRRSPRIAEASAIAADAAAISNSPVAALKVEIWLARVQWKEMSEGFAWVDGPVALVIDGMAF
jgi:hypothetical protein